MDLLIVFIVTVGIGCYRMYTTGGFVAEEIVLQDDGTISAPKELEPIGNNLSLKRDPDAFMLIIHEMGLG